MEQMYIDGEYLANNPDWHAEDSPTKAKWIRKILESRSQEINSIAEIGCGAGEILIELSKFYPHAHLDGYDISPQAFAICEPKSTEQVKFHHENILETGRGGFDVLLAIDVFEHVPDYISFIKAVKDCAKYKVFHIPLDLSAQGVLRGTGIMNARKELGHLHYFTKDTALATLSDCGYEIIDWNYTNGSAELPNRKLRTRLLDIPRAAIRLLNEDLAVRMLGGASVMVLAV